MKKYALKLKKKLREEREIFRQRAFRQRLDGWDISLLLVNVKKGLMISGRRVVSRLVRVRVAAIEDKFRLTKHLSSSKDQKNKLMRKVC